ncbi:MAG: hypothetical protein ABGW88_13630 [Leeuwenhoekiella sp.]|uniref:hypothetical protein n=1 Tax=Leeuwenhoekiella sp. TaxID=1977054 RepID=UPI0032425561
MSKIITKTELHNTRDGATCNIMIEISDFNESKEKRGFNAIVTDTAVKYVQEQIEPAESEEEPQFNTVLRNFGVLNRKAVFYPYELIDQLFTNINDPIVGTESFSNQLNQLQSKALLVVTQQTPIYGTTPEDWQILEEV